MIEHEHAVNAPKAANVILHRLFLLLLATLDNATPRGAADVAIRSPTATTGPNILNPRPRQLSSAPPLMKQGSVSSEATTQGGTLRMVNREIRPELRRQ
jgi:hypothetical protein